MLAPPKIRQHRTRVILPGSNLTAEIVCRSQAGAERILRALRKDARGVMIYETLSQRAE